MHLSHKIITYNPKALLTVIIPVRIGESENITLNSLTKGKFKDFNVIVCYDYESKGANAMRNKGFKLLKRKTKYVLFSDNDIEWGKNAIQTMIDILEKNNKVSFVYGACKMDGQIYCNKEFDAELLKDTNYISTMTVIRTTCFPYFDESIQRLQDWDLWLTMVKKGCKGMYCNQTIFTTKKRNGITFGNPMSYEDAKNILFVKHNII